MSSKFCREKLINGQILYRCRFCWIDFSQRGEAIKCARKHNPEVDR